MKTKLKKLLKILFLFASLHLGQASIEKLHAKHPHKGVRSKKPKRNNPKSTDEIQEEKKGVLSCIASAGACISSDGKYVYTRFMLAHKVVKLILFCIFLYCARWLLCKYFTVSLTISLERINYECGWKKKKIDLVAVGFKAKQEFDEIIKEQRRQIIKKESDDLKAVRGNTKISREEKQAKRARIIKANSLLLKDLKVEGQKVTTKIEDAETPQGRKEIKKHLEDLKLKLGSVLQKVGQN